MLIDIIPSDIERFLTDNLLDRIRINETEIIFLKKFIDKENTNILKIKIYKMDIEYQEDGLVYV
jgi:hypothetical protein